MSAFGFSMLPDDAATPEDDLAAAIASVDADPVGAAEIAEDPPAPLGRSWQFDFEAGRFVRAGAGPAETRGTGALAQWCMMAIHSARFAWPVFSDQFGMEQPESLLGHFAEGELLADWQRHLTEALLVHDRVSSVENMTLDVDKATGIVTILSLDVITDEQDVVTVEDVTIEGGM